ncbi:hypothetical protein RRG08_049814 [Elysia crispata]|uniref:Transmembrane protein n=1 Tax=Elysia crispata TaxID=231223 RepID=A0AAE0XPQ2_9GAST|nr:hypothetical protein RRG08_049814 [Elysia crispata]
MFEIIYVSSFVLLLGIRASPPKHSAAFLDMQWATVLVATSSTEPTANISDMYFNRMGKIDTSGEVFVDLLSLDVILQQEIRHEFRSCLIDAWAHADYCENNHCSPEEDPLRVHGVRFTMWTSAHVKGTSIWFYPVSQIPCDWFKESNVKEMEMYCDDCRFVFNKQRLLIVSEYTNSLGYLQVDWSIQPTEFLYVLGERPSPHEMPLSSHNEAVASAKHLSIEYLLEVRQNLNESVCLKSNKDKASTSKPLLTTEREDLKPMTTDYSEATTMSSTQVATEETTSMGTTATSDDINSYAIITTCVTVLPNGTATKSSFQVKDITDQSYTQEVESIYSHLVIPKTILGSYRRRLNSAPDKRSSSCVMGAFACVAISIIIGVVFFLDLSSWQRHWHILKWNLCHGKRQTAERKHRSGRVRRKDRTPVYALTIMGKILYSRIRRNSLVNRGVDLVRKISSCSLFGWSGRMLSSTKRVTKNSNCNIFRQKEVKVGFPPVTESKCSETIELNRNMNARPNSSTRQDLKEDMSSQSSQAEKVSTRNPNKIKQKFQRFGRHRGLVARSIGKRKLRAPMHNEGNRRGKIMHCLQKKKKHRAHSLPFRSLRSRVLSKSVQAEDATRVDNQDRSGSTIFRSLPNSLSGSQILSKTESPKDKATEAPAGQKDVSNVPKRKSRKWKTLMKLGNTVMAGHTSAQTSRKKRWDRKTTEQRVEQDQVLSHCASQSTDAPGQDNSKSVCSDNSEWPSLAVSTRTRSHAKETATELVRSRHSAQATKTMRKGCGDIVSKNNKDTASVSINQLSKDNSTTEAGPGQEKKTWASVAASGTSKCEIKTRKTSVNKTEQCGAPSTMIMPSGSANLKKKKKKVDYSLAYTDRIWLTCQQSKRVALVNNLHRKHIGDRKDSKFSRRKTDPASPRKKMSVEKRRERNHQEKQVGDDSLSHTSLKECYNLQSPAPFEGGVHSACTSSNRDSQGQNACLVDNMPVIFTKKAGMIFTLNESNPDRSNHKNVNKCNNRMNRAGHCRMLNRTSRRKKTSADCGVGSSDVSNTDLCSQLSSMTFQTPTASCCKLEIDASVSSETKKPLTGQSATGPCKVFQSNGQSNSSRATQMDGVNTKPKKVSLRYRALLRDGSGPLDARAVSDIHTRHRRADTLQDNKVATRAMRRRHRMEQQNTTRICRRVQASAAVADPKQTFQGGSSEQHEPNKYGKSPQEDAVRPARRPCTWKTPAAPQRQENELESSPSCDAGQVNSASSSASSGVDGAWRPSNNGTNNSRLLCERDESRDNLNPPLTSTRNSSCASVLGPVLASSAPQLSEHHSSIRLELRSNLHSLDMNWWNAYLRQPNDR